MLNNGLRLCLLPRALDQCVPLSKGEANDACVSRVIRRLDVDGCGSVELRPPKSGVSSLIKRIRLQHCQVTALLGVKLYLAKPGGVAAQNLNPAI